MIIETHKVATIQMKVTDQDGEVLEDTTSDDPFIYLHGVGGILPALEQSLEGKTTGESFKLTLSPEEAYGEYDEDLVDVLDREQFEGIESFSIGDQLEGETEDGIIPFTVIAIDGDEITVDANHFFAGRTLHFEIEVLDVRDATKEELEHGHVHVEGGCGC
ncbi:MAG: peptidylprolyl isomerase [Bdellovibrionales bacterium]|nr:peptidylprolyl isomerase [Bdellovibrionales bacterium]